MHYQYEAFVAEVARRIRELRLERGYSQRRFAMDYGYHLAQWQNIERGKHLSLRTLLRVATSFEITVPELVKSAAPLKGPGIGSKGPDLSRKTKKKKSSSTSS